MAAKILEFDANRRVPARRYTPIAMRGRLLVMPSRREAAAVESGSIAEGCVKKSVASAVPDSAQVAVTVVERSS